MPPHEASSAKSFVNHQCDHQPAHQFQQRGNQDEPQRDEQGLACHRVGVQCLIVIRADELTAELWYSDEDMVKTQPETSRRPVRANVTVISKAGATIDQGRQLFAVLLQTVGSGSLRQPVVRASSRLM